MAELYYKEAIKRNYDFLTEYLIADNVIPTCYQNGIISLEEKQELECVQNNKGNIAQAKKLITFILEKEDDVSKSFAAVLQDIESFVARSIEKTRKQILEGKILPYADINEISKSLRQKYKDQGWHFVEALPGEKFILDLDNPSFVMPADFESKIMDVANINEKIEQEQKFCRPEEINGIPEKTDPRYITRAFSCIEESFEEVNTQDINVAIPHIILCSGNAGTGKSILGRRCICEWTSDSNSHLAKYKATFLIPLRNIDRENSLMDILGEGRKCMNFLSNEQKKDLHQFLGEPTNAQQVLFVLDGADEVHIPSDSELFQLITGQIYQGVHILITARPEAESLQKIKPFLPVVKVKLKGTTEEGIYKYMKATLGHSDGVDSKEVEEILKKCEEQMFDFKLLYIPLYLALISFIFNEHWSKYASFSNFEIPDTVTKLFNSFMRVIVKIWLQKLNRLDEANKCTFNRCPLEKGSHLPFDIQRILVAIGKLAYYGIQNEIYSFNQDHLHQFLIDMNDLKISGLFCTSEDKTDEVFFRHKMMQEYLSAMYLCSVQFQDLNFQTWLNTNEYSHFTDDNLLPFICGMSPTFASEVVRKLHNIADISSSLEAEAVCCVEAGDPIFTKALASFITSGYYKINDSQYKPVVFKMLALFTSDEQINILEKHYGIYIKITDGSCIINQCLPKEGVTPSISGSSIYENEEPDVEGMDHEERDEKGKEVDHEEKAASTSNSCWPFPVCFNFRGRNEHRSRENVSMTDFIQENPLPCLDDIGKTIIDQNNKSIDIPLMNKISTYLLIINKDKFHSMDIEHVICSTTILDLRVCNRMFPSVNSLGVSFVGDTDQREEHAVNLIMQFTEEMDDNMLINLNNLTIKNDINVGYFDTTIYRLPFTITKQILKLSQLQKLHLVDTDITRSVLDTKHSLEMLHTFCNLLFGQINYDICETNLQKFIQSLPNLKCLHLFHHHIDMSNRANFEQELIANLSEETELVLCGVLTTNGVKQLFKKLPELHSLTSLCVGIDELGPLLDNVSEVLKKNTNIASFKVFGEYLESSEYKKKTKALVAHDRRITIVNKDNICTCVKSRS